MQQRGVPSLLKSTIVRFIAVISLISSGVGAASGPDDVAAPCVDRPLCATPEMAQWAATRVPRFGRSPTARLRLLYDALVAPEGLALREVDDVTATAAEAFVRREANCVSFALLFTSLARSLDLDVGFVRFDRVETYARRGGLRVGAAHLAVALRSGRRPVVIDFGGVSRPEEPWRYAQDREAIAIYHANRGAEHLTVGRVDDALSALDHAIDLAPHLDAAWVNRGVALSRAGRGLDAEAAYRRAIQLEPESLAAWRNLAILLTREPRR